MVSPDQPSSRDIELLSAYIDDALTDAERAALEARLLHDPALQRELDELRVVVQALRGLPPIKAPRNFTLTPEMVAIQQPEPKAATFLAFPTSAMFSALSAAAATVLILFGVLVLFVQSSAPQMAAQSPLGAAMEEAASDGVAAAPTDTGFSLNAATLVPQALTVAASSTASPTPAPTQTAMPQATSGIVLTAYVAPQAESNLLDADVADSEAAEVSADEAEADEIAEEAEALEEAAAEQPPQSAPAAREQTEEPAFDEDFAAGAAPAEDDTIAGDAPLPTATAQPTDKPTATVTPIVADDDGSVTGGAGAAATPEPDPQRSLATQPPPTAVPTRALLDPTGTIVSFVLTPPALQTRAADPTPITSAPSRFDPAIITGGGAIGLGLLLLGLAIATTVVRIRRRK